MRTESVRHDFRRPELHKPVRAAVVATLLLCATPLCQAGETALEVSLLAGPCLNCHVIDGQAPPSPIPSFANRSRDGLATLLNTFKSDSPPPGTTIMNRIAKGYTDAQIEALADYFALHNVETICCRPEKKP